ncbi:MAG: redoxin domain-containing protein [Planctomycetes bacterium]|nr:redoxin domain-containing protein [Planctomycetota bacterium]
MRIPILALALVLVPFGADTSPQDPRPMTKEEPKPAGPEIGKPAPAFRLNDQLGNAVAVGGETDHWVVLAFYPKASTPG